MKNLEILQQRILIPILNKKNSGNLLPLIAVVGNAGVSKQDQEKIDRADIVIRFNNYATREKISHTQDPFRCDVLFSTFDLHSQGSSPSDVVIGIPYPFKVKEIYDKPKRWYPNSRLWMVNPYENMKMCEDLSIDSLGHYHPLPSIGFTALWHMKDWRAEFFIAGFNWYFSEETGKFQGWDLKRKDYPRNWNHNYPKEIEWIVKNLYGKININFSETCTRLLNIARSTIQ